MSVDEAPTGTSVDGVNATVAALRSAEMRHAPYPHLDIPQFFRRSDAAAIVDWLQRDAKWWAQERDFYQHDTCENLDECPLIAEDQILGIPSRAALAATLEQRLGIELDQTYPTLGAHRMRAGHGIGIHSDSPEGGSEHIRLLVTLRAERFVDDDGGQLLLCGDATLGSLGAVFRPSHNAAVAFPLTASSYHAVNDVQRGTRYSLVYGFWDRSQMRTAIIPAQPRRSRSIDEVGGLEGAGELIAALTAAGADRLGHSGASLLDHLIGVTAVLIDWGCAPAVCRAGLFHSVYGTATFRRCLFAESQRHEVRALIGEHAERLVWLFSTVRFSEVYRRSGESTFLARRRDDSSPVRLEHSDIVELNLISCANMFEQLRAEELSPGDVFEWRAAIDNLADDLPERALAAMRRTFGGETER